MRCNRCVWALPALVMMAAVLTATGAARGETLLYEPFDYPVGELLNGQTQAASTSDIGMTGDWTAWDHNAGAGIEMTLADGPRDPYQWRSWDGVAHNIVQAGNFISLGFDGRAHVNGYRMMDSSVTDTFTSGSVTWMSVVAAQSDTPWGFWPLLAIGADGLTEDRGTNALGAK
ncbi:MAG: hypothetical protein HQ567_11235 [Candidatus Nealsonbacteria bacterium]|nr:hypothetical protein [Candidatus Nealsonbacteria bacterium]